MKTSHTPGPWVARLAVANNAPNYWSIGPKAWGAPSVATTYDADVASLIASAPALLDILERILRAHDSENDGTCTGEALLCGQFAELARAAIAEARKGVI
jgi:hypothetical protein